MKTIAIIGAGFSGTMTAVNLIRSEIGPVKIILIDKGQYISKGVAYKPYSKNHLLNVTASKMSAFSTESEHFLNWLMKHSDYSGINREILSNSFLPRHVYGKYLEVIWKETLQNANTNIEIDIVDSLVLDIEIISEKYFLSLENGKTIESDLCVIATGNHLPRNPSINNADFYNSNKYFQNPWDGNSVNNVDKSFPVLIIGNGLTMVDTVIGLLENGFDNNIISVSPNGFNILPHRHSGTKYDALVREMNDDPTFSEIVKLFNKHIKIVKQFGLSAEPVIDSIRPFTQGIWQKMNLQEKKTFMSRFRHLWGVARHRIPLHLHEKIQHLRIENKLHIHAGKLIDITDRGSSAEVLFYNKRKRVLENIHVSRVINCTGPESDLSMLKNSFLNRSLEKGIIAQDELKLGINADPNTFQVINKNNIKHIHLFVMGTNLRGILWESTAVNELRSQAEKLSQHLSSIVTEKSLPKGIPTNKSHNFRT